MNRRTFLQLTGITTVVGLSNLSFAEKEKSLKWREEQPLHWREMWEEEPVSSEMIWIRSEGEYYTAWKRTVKEGFVLARHYGYVDGKLVEQSIWITVRLDMIGEYEWIYDYEIPQTKYGVKNTGIESARKLLENGQSQTNPAGSCLNWTS